MEPTVVEVGPAQAGERLDRYSVATRGIARARARHLLVGRVVLAGRPLGLPDKSRIIAGGDEFGSSETCAPTRSAPRSAPGPAAARRRRRRGWLVVDKPRHRCPPAPSGSARHGPERRRRAASQIVGIGEGGLRSGVVHRLDVDTTGALVFAFDEVWRRLRGAFSDHRVDKRYLALVAGR
ncbi:MAG: pseudouridine synthase [Myxococcota bacterium]